MIVEITDERAVEIIEKTAHYIVKKKMGSAAIMAIESFRPLHNLGSQGMFFLAPFAEVFFNATEYQEFAVMLEKEDNIKQLLKRIDELDEEYYKEERQTRKLLRKRRANKIKAIFKRKNR